MGSTLRAGRAGRSIRNPNARSIIKLERALSVGGGGRSPWGVLRSRRGLPLRLLIGHVMADGAAADRAQNAMMPSVMAGDAADERALEAPLRLSGRRGNRQHGKRGQHR